MIKIEKTEIFGWEATIRGMRNPLKSWDKSDSYWDEDDGSEWIGPNDEALMLKLAKAGSSHAKFRRFIIVTCDITAPLYWWKEFDTYKVGTVANSESTMHTITKKPFELSDFSTDQLTLRSLDVLNRVISELNFWRGCYADGAKVEMAGELVDCWYQLIQLLPSSYNQKRTVLLNYEVLARMYHDRKNHKLQEWRDFCEFIESLQLSAIITTPTVGETQN